jgi:putative oxygen-independent coproporphyrinogen III oxidase
MLGIYLHIPFCSAICNYCNFNRGLFDGAVKERYVEALVAEISRFDGRPDGDTVYFGGGTPSLLEPVDVARLLEACVKSFNLSAGAEITLEANPESVTAERLGAFRSAGVNRVSFGVQSFRDEELGRLSRLHNAVRGRSAYHEARAAGFDNVSLDLMMWLPGQRVDEWLASVDAAIELAPEHLSLYLLEVYPNAPLKDEMARARWSQAPDDDAAAMYLEAMARLEAAGLVQYEISNVSRPGRRSRHNLKYWSDGEWVGFGCGAHSTRGGRRWKNVAGTQEYIDCIAARRSPAIEVRTMTHEERLGDALFTGLRLADGVEEQAIRDRYGVGVWDRYGPDLEPFVESGVLMRMDGRLRLTRRGMLVAHEVMLVFV